MDFICDCGWSCVGRCGGSKSPEYQLHPLKPSADASTDALPPTVTDTDSLVRYRLVDHGAQSSSLAMGPGFNDTLSNDPNTYPYGVHQMHGARRQKWLDDAESADCAIYQTPIINLKGLIHHKNLQLKWENPLEQWGPPPVNYHQELESLYLPTDTSYRQIRIRKSGRHPVRGEARNDYLHYTARGVLIAMDIVRVDGPHWSDIALAQYTLDHPVDTLKHIFFHHVINNDTRDFFISQLYPRRSRLQFGDSHLPAALVPVVWNYGTPEYQAILGTAFGKSVCALLISAFPRGTVCVARVVSWMDHHLQLRFDVGRR